MRLIDATKLEDLLRRQMEMDWNKQAAPASWSAAYEQILEELGETPVVDAVPVVRCRDCKYCSPGLTREERSIPGADLVCAYWDSDGLDANDFCSSGERKGEDDGGDPRL